MSHQRIKCAVAAAALIAASACSNTPDEEPMPDAVAPPDTPTRSLPTRGGPGGDVGPPEVDAPSFQLPDVEEMEQACCEVRFALADPNGREDEESGRLRGSAAPLNGEEGVELTFADGVWSATVCMPPTYGRGGGTYHYEFAIRPDPDKSVLTGTRTNPNVEVTTRDRREVNVWTPANSCEELDADVHGRTSSD